MYESGSSENFIRDFEEFDEKLPAVAKVIVRRRIDVSLLNSEKIEVCIDTYRSVCVIFREMVECTTDMTADEFEHYVCVLITACDLVVLIN